MCESCASANPGISRALGSHMFEDIFSHVQSIVGRVVCRQDVSCVQIFHVLFRTLYTGCPRTRSKIFEKKLFFFFEIMLMWLNRGVFIIKLLYKIFFDISNNFREKPLYIWRVISPLKIVFKPQLEISKFICLLFLHVCKVLSKSSIYI